MKGLESWVGDMVLIGGKEEAVVAALTGTAAVAAAEWGSQAAVEWDSRAEVERDSQAAVERDSQSSALSARAVLMAS
jgi:hypothetical protein